MADYLVHYGVLGQKWGIRRYQNPDGTLTPAGLKRYSYSNGQYGIFKSNKIVGDLNSLEREKVKLKGDIHRAKNRSKSENQARADKYRAKNEWNKKKLADTEKAISNILQYNNPNIRSIKTNYLTTRIPERILFDVGIGAIPITKAIQIFAPHVNLSGIGKGAKRRTGDYYFDNRIRYLSAPPGSAKTGKLRKWRDRDVSWVAGVSKRGADWRDSKFGYSRNG